MWKRWIAFLGLIKRATLKWNADNCLRLGASLWILLAIAFYIALSSYLNDGTIGAILALVAWVYLSSQVLFLGGEFTAVYAQQYGSRSGDSPDH